MGGVWASTVAVRELGSRELTAWRELAAQAAEPNPFFEPEFVLPAARHLGERGVGLLVVHGADGAWLACMPVRAHVRVGHAVVPGLTVWRHRYCFLGTPLVARTSVEVACEGLVELALHAARFGVLALPWLGDDGPVSAALLAALDESGRRPSLHRSSARAVIRRDGLDVLMSSRHRRDLGRVARRLAEELDAPLELRDRGEEASAVEEFLAIESAGWKGERGTAMAAHGSDAAFFREMCSGFRAAGRLQLLALGDDAHAVSFQCNLLTSEAVFHFKIAFDETFARFKPGTLLELRMLEEFRERMTQQWIDSCAAPDSPQFGRLRTDRRQLGSYVIGARRVVSWTLDHGLVRLAEQHHDQVLA